MGVTVPINKHLYAFRRAWKEQVYTSRTYPNNLSLDDSAKAWWDEMEIRMISSTPDGQFDKAEFKSEADYVAFLLKWN